MNCTGNEVYSADLTKTCDITCADYAKGNSDPQCNTTGIGCVCADNFYRRGTECVPESVCLDEICYDEDTGETYAVGSLFGFLSLLARVMIESQAPYSQSGLWSETTKSLGFEIWSQLRIGLNFVFKSRFLGETKLRPVLSLSNLFSWINDILFSVRFIQSLYLTYWHFQ